jgi:hypothetical protein
MMLLLDEIRSFRDLILPGLINLAVKMASLQVLKIPEGPYRFQTTDFLNLLLNFKSKFPLSCVPGIPAAIFCYDYFQIFIYRFSYCGGFNYSIG